MVSLARIKRQYASGTPVTEKEKMLIHANEYSKSRERPFPEELQPEKLNN